MVHHLHAPASQHIGGAHHHRITDAVGDFQRLLHRGGHSRLGHGNPQLVHHGPEQISVLRQIYDLRRCPQNAHAVFLQLRRQIQRRLSPELGNDAHGFFLPIDTEHILQSQRLKIQFVGGIVIRGHRLRITVDDDGLKAQLLQRQRSMDAAIIKFDSLSDAVGAPSQNHHLGLVSAHGVFILSVVGGVIIGAVRRSADMNPLPDLFRSQSLTPLAHLLLGDAQQQT